MAIAGKAARGVGRTIKWALILGALVIVVIIIAAVIGLGSAASDSDKSSAQVSRAKFAAVKTGMAKPAVRTLLGKPERTDETQVNDLSMECWYYGILSADGSYQFCFDNGKLASKSRY